MHRTGLVLVPEDQIHDLPIPPRLGFEDADAGVCPYCVYYYDEEYEQDGFEDDGICTECPMAKAGNWCNKTYEDPENMSTYQRVNNAVIQDRDGNNKTMRIVNLPEIIALVNEYNKSNGYQEPLQH